MKVHVPRVQFPSGNDEPTSERSEDDVVYNDEGLVFHVQVGYRSLLVIVAILTQAVYIYADVIAGIFGYNNGP